MNFYTSALPGFNAEVYFLKADAFRLPAVTGFADAKFVKLKECLARFSTALHRLSIWMRLPCRTGGLLLPQVGVCWRPVRAKHLLPVVLMVLFALTRWPGLMPWNFSAA